MTTTINASPTNGLVQTADGSGILKVQSNGVTTNALAWVNFNGTTSPGTIRSAYNVGSVTKNGTGDYTLNFTATLSDANYAVTFGALAGSLTNVTSVAVVAGVYSSGATTKTTSALRMLSGSSSSGALADCADLSVSIFGN